MDFWIDVFSSGNNILTFVFVVLLFYGGLWIISKITESPGKASTPPEKYNFYNPNERRKPSDPIITRVVGVTFDNRQKVIRSLNVGELLELVPEPDNPHDPNAVKVIRKSGEQVGYLDRELAKDISWVFSASEFSRPAKVLEIVGDESKGQSLGVIIEIYPPSLDEALVSSNLKYPPF